LLVTNSKRSSYHFQ